MARTPTLLTKRPRGRTTAGLQPGPSRKHKGGRAGARRYRSEPVELGRVVDEDAVARPLVGDPLGEEVEEVAVVRHRHLEPDMRPVAAPEEAVGPRLGEL